MRRFTNKQMKSLLDEVGAGIKNSKDNPMVLENVQEFGYTPEIFTDAENLRQEAERLFLAKGPRAGQKISLSIQLRNEIDEIHSLFMIYAQLVRRDLKENPALFSEFNLSGARDYSISGKIMEPKGFYKNCQDNGKLSTYVAKYGLTPEKMQAQIDRIGVVESDKTVRAVLVKEAEKTTDDRNKVFQRLSDWWLNYKIVLLYVFKDDPQQLEAFGIKGYSEGYKPKPKEKNTGTQEPNPDPPGANQDAQDTQDTETPTDTTGTSSG